MSAHDIEGALRTNTHGRAAFDDREAFAAGGPASTARVPALARPGHPVGAVRVVSASARRIDEELCVTRGRRIQRRR